jgi:hypothetical protein
MEMILKLMGAGLGLLAPALFALTLNKGIRQSPFEETKKVWLRKRTFSVLLAWTAIVWIFSLTGVFSYHAGDVYPRFLLPLVIPVLIGVAFLFNRDVRTMVEHIPLFVMAGVQTFRFAGFAFILITHLGILPAIFASGGLGDILTGALALSSAILLSRNPGRGRKVFLALTAVGIIDLANVAFLLLWYYPIWYSSVPNSAPAGDFSLIMIPALAAPVALLLHVYGLKNFVSTT